MRQPTRADEGQILEEGFHELRLNGDALVLILPFISHITHAHAHMQFLPTESTEHWSPIDLLLFKGKSVFRVELR